ncbi:MAG: hypothetical protein MUE58_02855 [Chitinophagaceae bacterium]|nr:hypothetical protein [Chitinophagaceae bacterium]
MLRILFIALLSLGSFRPAEIPVPLSPAWVVESGSLLNIEGSSNINRFTCHIRQYLQSDTLRWVRDDRAKKLVFRNSAVNIDISQFDCHQKYITSDLRKTLRADKYPQLRIHFLSMDDLTWVQEGQKVRGQVNIELAGHIKRYDMEYTVIHEQGNRFRLCGSKQILFSDFNLVPPGKLAGLVRINQEIKVNFELHFRPFGS